MRMIASPFRARDILMRLFRSDLKTAFTLLELLVVMAIIGILGGLLLTVLGKARHSAHGVICSNNLRQLQLTIFLYAADHDDFVVWTAINLRRSWVYSAEYARLTHRPEGTTNVQWLIDPKLAAYADYISNPGVYKCPGDNTKVAINDRWHSWVRSYGATFLQRKMQDFDRAKSLDGQPVPPSRNYTFSEPHPGYLHGVYGVNADGERFATFPAYWHNGTAGFAFADGHVELRRWVDPRTKRPLEDKRKLEAGTSVIVFSPGNADSKWIGDHKDCGLWYNRQERDFAALIVQ
jgi:prepilin-type N-terminal cleavage/methylation domain-containing protein/prepilin-type processing-associated H-X9-DG protein